MRKSILGVLVLLAVAVPTARAGGSNISFGTGCWAENPASSQTFACDVNTGSVAFTASSTLNNPIPDLVGFDVRVDGEALALLPDWWQLAGAGSCRGGGLVASGEFDVAPQVACTDLYGGQAIAGVTHYWTALNAPPHVGPPPSRFTLRVYTSLAEPVMAEAGVEYYVCRVRISYAKTVGADACAGCAAPLAMALMGVVAMGAESGSFSIGRPSENWCLTWQNGAPPCTAVPAHNVTWGQVKTLYR